VPYRVTGAERWIAQWIANDRPSKSDIEQLRQWLTGLGFDPRQSPSAETAREHPYPQDELRGAFLFGAGGVFVAYAVDGAGEIVRILHIGADPPMGMVFPAPW
jgi:hypothetical protein